MHRVEPALRSFYIFNSSFGRKEGEEHKKILYYYPDDIELNTKIKDVGLSEAIIAFTGTFVSEDDCKALHTQKTTQLFYQPEAGYWMVMVVKVPKEVRVKDGVDVADFRGGEINDRIYRAMLRQTYNMFKLFEGTFQMNAGVAAAEQDSVQERLRLQLKEFFDKHVLTLKLPACDILDITRSIQYLPLNKFLFLRAHNFISMIRETYSIIKETVLLYNEQIVCSGNLDPNDLYSLHEYMVYTLLPEALQSDTTSASSTSSSFARSNSSATEIFRDGAFITGPEGDDGIATKSPPKVFLKNGKGDLHAHYLITFRALNATLCLFTDGQVEQPQNEFYAELHTYMGPQLISIARDIGETLEKQQNGKLSISADTGDGAAMAPKYLFINEQSLKHLSNISSERRRKSTTAHGIPLNVMNIIADLGRSESEPSDGNAPAFEETLVKSTNDFWVVARRCNWRQYYVIICNSKATLLDVTQEAKRIFEQELTDDVFFDK